MAAANPPFQPARALAGLKSVGLAYKWQVMMVLLPGIEQLI